MQITRQNRINSIPGEMISHMRQMCEKFRDHLTKGIELPAGTPPGMPAFKCSADEIKEAFGENLKAMETVIEFVLDGKSNQITKKVKPPN